jgi:uncharacterized membrane protein YdjX (TVP38/TMEM64 family)
VRVGETFTQHAVVWRRAAFLALLCIALAAITASTDLHVALLEVLAASRDLIVGHPVLGALLFVLLAAVSAMFFFFSSAILVPVAVYAWGELLTMLMLWLGWTLGGGVAYGIARYFGRPVVRWLMVDRALRRIERRIRPDTPFKYVLLFQLGLPSEIPGYILGLVKYPFGKFLLARALAELPFTIATIYLGAGIVSARSGLLLAVGLAIAALSVVSFYLLRRYTSSQRT